MAYTDCPVTTNVISQLGTKPDERGLTTEQFKAKFDQFGTDFVAWFNATHLAEDNALQATVGVNTSNISDNSSNIASNAADINKYKYRMYMEV